MNSFLHGKKALGGGGLRPLTSLVPVAGRLIPQGTRSPLGKTPTPDCAAQPQVEAIKEGDKIVRLVVTCTCGERVEIECLYSAGG